MYDKNCADCSCRMICSESEVRTSDPLKEQKNLEHLKLSVELVNNFVKGISDECACETCTNVLKAWSYIKEYLESHIRSGKTAFMDALQASYEPGKQDGIALAKKVQEDV